MRKLRLRKNNLSIVATAIFLLLLVMITAGHAASFTATLDRDSISLGESATLSLSFQGAQPNNVPTPDIPGLQIVNSGTSQNVSYINGAMNATVTVTFSVTPQRTGKFTIPAMRADINGEQITSQPIELTVAAANAPSAAAVNSGSQVAFMKLVLPQQKVYVGETLAAELQIYLRDDVRSIANFQMISSPADGFVVGKNAQGARFQTQAGGRNYTVIPLSIALTVTRSGDLSLGPFNASLIIFVPSQNQGGDPFFSQFFNQGDQKEVTLTTEATSAQSLPLPTGNVPKNFNGAIGDYTMSVTAGPTNVTVGDPITVHVQISGRGALDAIRMPDQSAWNDFKIFAPTTKTEISDSLGQAGTKTFEEIVTPQSATVHELPEFSFSFFNPDDGQYHTLKQPPERLMVRAGGVTPMPAIAANKNSAQESQAPQDVLPIKQELGTLTAASGPLILRPSFLAVQALPVIAFVAAFVWRKRTDNLANNPRLRRQRLVAQLVEMGIGDLKKCAVENSPETFFTTLFRLLQEQLGERLDCPASAITEAVVDDLATGGASEELLGEVRELFQLCNQARYAPIRGSEELNSVAAKFEKVAHELQSLSL
ncbi:MAG TPA: BatD family protein [Verrucomicrobiae bacterium]